MGFVSTFCPISGCSPIAGEALATDIVVEDALAELGTRGFSPVNFMSAIEDLESESKKNSSLTVIGCISQEGRQVFEEGFGDSDLLCREHIDSVRIVSGCFAGDMFEFGSVQHPTLLNANGQEQDYLVSYGAQIMVLSWALPILYLATESRIDARRLWKFSMKLGHNMPHDHYVCPGIDYGAITNSIDQFLNPLPNVDRDGAVEEYLETIERESANAEEVKQRLIDDGGFWCWMAADAFPLDCADDHAHLPEPILIEQISVSEPRNQIDRLPFDVVSHIASFLPLSSLVSLASTTRPLRHLLFGSASARSQTMRKWMLGAGQYWLPVEVNLGTAAPSDGSVPLVKDLPNPEIALLELTREDDDWWHYVRRCAKSGSMRNRKRVWEVARQIEAKADELGV